MPSFLQRDEVRRRRERVWKLRHQGVETKELARMYGVTQRTILRDYEIMEKEKAAEVAKQT